MTENEPQEAPTSPPPAIVSTQAPDHELQLAEPAMDVLEHDLRSLVFSEGQLETRRLDLSRTERKSEVRPAGEGD
jgi:hypothetical protein